MSVRAVHLFAVLIKMVFLVYFRVVTKRWRIPGPRVTGVLDDTRNSYFYVSMGCVCNYLGHGIYFLRRVKTRNDGLRV